MFCYLVDGASLIG